MARVPSKHGRDQLQDFEGLLNNLQDWELSFKDKEKKMKSPPIAPEKMDCSAQRHSLGNASKLSTASLVNGGQIVEKSPSHADATRQRDYIRDYDSISHLSNHFMDGESSIDANSEKELGNEFFKKKKFNEAIDCYSRSIALSPTAVAYANRAMAYLKIKRFQEAENDCTEALNLDDRYIKAYSRRSTARKELGKLRESIEDAEFALRLEPQNQEIKKQCTEIKALYEKEILKRASGALGGPAQKAGMAKVEFGKSDNQAQSSPGGSKRVDKIQEHHVKNKEVPSATCREVNGRDAAAAGVPVEKSNLESAKRNTRNGKQELKASVQELAARASSLATIEAAKNIRPPTSAYQFEVSWRGLSGDRSLQAHLLKVISPAALPQIFKTALSVPLLVDIIKCIASFFTEDMDLAVKYLDNLTKVPRFEMIIMCLSSVDKRDLGKIWSEVFGKGTAEYVEILDKLRVMYGLKQ